MEDSDLEQRSDSGLDSADAVELSHWTVDLHDTPLDSVPCMRCSVLVISSLSGFTGRAPDRDCPRRP